MPRRKQMPQPGKGDPQTPVAPDAGAPPEIEEVEQDFPIIGIGTSAGGLAALEAFFSNLPATTTSGMAFVLVQHLDPDHKSILAELIRHYTSMQVFEIADGMVVQPNCAYIIPPRKDLTLMNGRLHLTEPAAARGLRLPIDAFFRSLARDRHERAICVVLSGTGSDGTLGLKEVKAEGGMAMAQDPKTAAYDGMPRSAIGTGLVDYVLPAAEMPAQLAAYVGRAYGAGRPEGELPPTHSAGAMHKIFLLLRNQTRHDFSEYKQNTILRRIERRMAVSRIERLEDYVRYLQQNPLEVEALFRELLIGVTSFFRDPQAFEILRDTALLPLLTERRASQPLRIWVPGCSTGEEAFSVAILVREAMDKLGHHGKVQLFATDIDVEAIDKARLAIYPHSIAADVSAERLERFFLQRENSYQIQRSIRDMVVFAAQNVIEDPPFSRMDLISCRNLLIYLGPELQKKVIPLFHYALNPDGFLLLGTSETVAEHPDFFSVADRKWKLYQRKPGPTPRPLGQGFRSPALAALDSQAPPKTGQPLGIRDLAEKTLLELHTPPSAIINEKGEVLFIHGHTGQYLELAGGDAGLNIIRMAREGLRLDLTTAIRKVVSHKEAVSVSNLQVKANGDTVRVDLMVSPLSHPAASPGLLLVVFRARSAPDGPDAEPAPGAAGDTDQRIGALERELHAKDEYLQTTIEELETTNEELQSTNEELQSSNEEMQSANEEMETSKEELQSVNEELITVNMELQQKLDLLSQANDDMNNLLAGTGVGTLYLGNHLTVERFTPAVTKIVNLIETDVGRPVGHIVTNLLGYDRMVQDVQTVLDTLAPMEVEVQTTEGRWYLMRILPYRTVENAINGVVLTFVDISDSAHIREQLQHVMADLELARDYAESIVATVRQPLIVLDAGLTVISANPAALQTFQFKREDVIGRHIYDLGDGQWGKPELRRLLEEILPAETSLSDYPLTFEIAGSPQIRLLNVRELRQASGKDRRILLAVGMPAEGVPA